VTAHPTTITSTAPTGHPLERLTAEEIRATRDILQRAGLLTETTRCPLLALEEPAKSEVLAFTAGDPIRRRLRALLLDTATGLSRAVKVSLTSNDVESVTELDPLLDGQPPIMFEDYVAADEIVKADPGWRAAMAARGITDLDLVRPCPLSAGSFDIPGEKGRRMLRVLSFLQNRPSDHCWAHPIDGVVAYIDLITREVVELVDTGVVPVPTEEGNFDDPEYTGPPRTTQRPIVISQPEGPSFTVDGDTVSWEGWTFRIGFDPREGLVLHQLAINGRPVLYRASIAEMVVPYADPGPIRFWQNYFDAGEYLLGPQANSLALGCDCVGQIRYFDAVVADSGIEPQTIENAICMHEEDAGVLWKHTDLFTESSETRRQRRLVVSFFLSIGNYDYGFYWYLYLDGTIELEVKSTGVVFTTAWDGAPWASEIAPGLGAPLHQHLFCARLDMTVDGVPNTVDEVDVQPLPVGPDNPHANAFGRTFTRIARESQSGRTADGSRARVWRIASSQNTNRLGQPAAYQLQPEGQPTLLAQPSSAIAHRAAFATRHLWVTRYHPDERYPAGELVNQHPGGAGIPSWIAADRSLDGEDIVLWHTFGMTHVPRPEEWPVIPVASSGFTLRPHGFFDRNPTLDIPR
jgi:primary-amine oxidase